MIIVGCDGIHGTASGHWGAGATKSAFDAKEPQNLHGKNTFTAKRTVV